MRLIDADELEERCDIMADKFDGMGASIWNQFRTFVEWMPTIEERKSGMWIDDNCSVCGQYVYHGDARNYCPNCGAKMETDNET